MAGTTAGHRGTMEIVQSILECVLRARPDPALKSHIIQYANLKSSMADKYLTSLEAAGYIIKNEAQWGERTIYQYEITEKGIERYKLFLEINAEINL
ncbi:MAG TPA: winged helix-turn-helix domain-containing protein [Candidatus Lokiarchaeia archaeon]|nr:winged helix-turn-helix domain-containing protein [Candidatus Lokiarchaeia archaeon]